MTQGTSITVSYNKTITDFHFDYYYKDRSFQDIWYCSGLASEIKSPQVVFYPLIESSNIPRWKRYKNIDKVILCVAIHVLGKQYYVSRTVLTLVPGHLNFTKANENMAKFMENMLSYK